MERQKHWPMAAGTRCRILSMSRLHLVTQNEKRWHPSNPNVISLNETNKLTSRSTNTFALMPTYVWQQSHPWWEDEKNYIKFFNRRMPHHFSFSTSNVTAIFWRGSPPSEGVEWRWDMIKSRFSTNISLYLENDTRQAIAITERHRNPYTIYRMVLFSMTLNDP